MFVPFFLLHLQILPFCVLFFTLLWAVSLPLKDASIVDRFWGLGFMFFYVVSVIYTHAEITPKNIIGFVLISLWALRLSIHIHTRNKGHAEDYRYQEMRKKYHPFALLSLPIVFWSQAVILWIVALPLLSLIVDREHSNWSNVGILIWAVGLYFEARGDWELKEFKKNPTHKGQLLTTGLWSLTRHPNYFGDTLMWWGIFIFCLPVGWYTAIGPIFMTFFIVKVSGVSLTDKSLSQSKPGFEGYIKSTPAFFPKITGYKSFER